MSQETGPAVKQYLLISDFDQTLSFNDSGIVRTGVSVAARSGVPASAEA